MLLLISIMGIMIALILFVGLLIMYVTHISMVIDEKKPYDYVSFKTFLRVFNEYNQKYRLIYSDFGSIVNSGSQTIVYIHADIIRFENKCMILYPLSYVIFKVWKYNKCKTHNRQKGLWKTEEVK